MQTSATYTKRWRQRHPARAKQATRKAELKRKYQLTEQDYLSLWQKQNGLCAICGRPETKVVKGTAIPLAVDHDHKTGQRRGLLCSACNLGLGKFEDSLSRVSAAATYLQTYHAH